MSDSLGQDKHDAEEYKQLYKDSVDILGVSLDELEEFMNPDKPTRNQVSSVEKILDKFQRMENEKDEVSGEVAQKGQSGDQQSAKAGLQISEEIEMVHDYCMKLIDALGD